MHIKTSNDLVHQKLVLPTGSSGLYMAFFLYYKFTPVSCIVSLNGSHYAITYILVKANDFDFKHMKAKFGSPADKINSLLQYE